MISTFFGLETGKRGVLTHRISLETASHNIVNAETPGYSRQRVNLNASRPYTVPQMTRTTYPGQAGSGVEAESIERVRSLFLDKQVHTQMSIQEHWSSRADNLTQVQYLFNEPSDDAIRGEIEQFWKALEDLANDPETAATRQVVVERGIGLSNSIEHLYTELTELRDVVDLEFQFKIDEINSISEQITNLNGKIKSIHNLGDNANDLMDQRDLLIEDLSKLINVNTDYYGYQQEELVISIGGQTLIQGTSFNRMNLQDNRLNDSLSDAVWELNQVPLSSNEDIFRAFANSSVANQTSSIEVQKLAKTDMLESQVTVPYVSQPLASEANNPEITSGYVHINGKRMYVDPEKESMLDIIENINALNAGVMASRSDDGLNRLVLTADDSGEEYRINLEAGYKGLEEPTDKEEVWMAELSSNLFHKLGVTTSYWGDEGVIDTTANLYSIQNSQGTEFLPPAGGKFTINGYSINVSSTNPSFGSSISLRELRDEINDREKYPDMGVHAILVKNDAGRHQMVLEGEDGNYNYTIQDNDGLLSNLGITVNELNPNDRINAGSIVSSARFEKDEDNEFEFGILDNGPPSIMQIEDSNGDVANITIDNKSDSLSVIAELINAGSILNSVDAEAQILKTPDNEYRLAIVASNGEELTLTNVSGDLMDRLGFQEGTYTNKGPLHLDGQDARFVHNGIVKTSNSNRVEDLVPGTVVEFTGVGLAVMETRTVFQSGTIKGLLEVRDEIIPEFLEKLDELAYTVGEKMNEAHYNGFGLDGVSQRNFFLVHRSSVSGQKYSGAARSMGVSQSIIDDVNRIGAAAADSTLTKERGLPVSAGVGSGHNALDMAKLKQGKIMNNETSSFDEFFASIIAKVGVQGQEAERMFENQELLLNKLENERQSVMGVSLDEEMTNLVKFQHAFQASSRVISMMDSMLDTIINKMRG